MIPFWVIVLVCAAGAGGVVFGVLYSEWMQARKNICTQRLMAEVFENAANKPGVSEEFRAEMREFATFIRGVKL